MSETSETKIIKTFRGEIIFLISFVGFMAGILGAYYRLVGDVAVMKNEQQNQTSMLKAHLEQYSSHLSENKTDHDALVKIQTLLKINN